MSRDDVRGSTAAQPQPEPPSPRGRHLQFFDVEDLQSPVRGDLPHDLNSRARNGAGIRNAPVMRFGFGGFYVAIVIGAKRPHDPGKNFPSKRLVRMLTQPLLRLVQEPRERLHSLREVGVLADEFFCVDACLRILGEVHHPGKLGVVREFGGKASFAKALLGFAKTRSNGLRTHRSERASASPGCQQLPRQFTHRRRRKLAH